MVAPTIQVCDMAIHIFKPFWRKSLLRIVGILFQVVEQNLLNSRICNLILYLLFIEAFINSFSAGKVSV